MTDPGNSLRDLAARLRAALESNDVSALGELLDPDVTWGACAGRDDVVRHLGTMTPEHVSDVAMDVLDDRLVASFRFGHGPHTQVHHQAIFATNGRIVEICDVADGEQARAVRPVGPLPVAAARPSSFSDLAPVLPVRNLAAAIDHYRSLGFDVRAYDGDAPYAFAERDGVHLHLAGFADLDPAQNTSAVYLYVSDADALYAQWRAVRPSGRLFAPRDTEYGLREGAHGDADGNLLRFGSPLG